jgi:hypothetical protein
MKFEATGEYKPFLSYKGTALYYHEENNRYVAELHALETLTVPYDKKPISKNVFIKLEADSLEELDQDFKSFVDAFS